MSIVQLLLSGSSIQGLAFCLQVCKGGRGYGLGFRSLGVSGLQVQDLELRFFFYGLGFEVEGSRAKGLGST